MLSFANNATSKLLVSATAADTVITVENASKFPALASGNTFVGVLADDVDFEIVTCTALSGNVITCVRGQEGTSAKAWPIGTVFENRVTAATLANFVPKAQNTADNGKFLGISSGQVTPVVAPVVGVPWINRCINWRAKDGEWIWICSMPYPCVLKIRIFITGPSDQPSTQGENQFIEYTLRVALNKTISWDPIYGVQSTMRPLAMMYEADLDKVSLAVYCPGGYVRTMSIWSQELQGECDWYMRRNVYVPDEAIDVTFPAVNEYVTKAQENSDNGKYLGISNGQVIPVAPPAPPTPAQGYIATWTHEDGVEGDIYFKYAYATRMKDIVTVTFQSQLHSDRQNVYSDDTTGVYLPSGFRPCNRKTIGPLVWDEMLNEADDLKAGWLRVTWGSYEIVYWRGVSAANGGSYRVYGTCTYRTEDPFPTGQ